MTYTAEAYGSNMHWRSILAFHKCIIVSLSALIRVSFRFLFRNIVGLLIQDLNAATYCSSVPKSSIKEILYRNNI